MVSFAFVAEFDLTSVSCQNLETELDLNACKAAVKAGQSHLDVLSGITTIKLSERAS